ncbi:MAG: family 78 glycoside hydrolase catalytic domain [Bacillota bacterium]|nr:family 78 glycoside hydrolase catalytic domain [Bacillota bacterium]
MLICTDLRCDGRQNPRAVATLKPDIGWRIESDEPNVKQAAWQLRAALCDTRMAGIAEDWHESAWQEDPNSQLRVWPELAGLQLRHDGRYIWQVRIRDQEGQVSDWSRAAAFEVYLDTEAAWQAAFITTEEERRCLRLRRLIELAADDILVDAVLRATALGVYDLELDGRPVSRDRLMPGWTEYRSRLLVSTCDLTGPLLDLGSRGRSAAWLDVRVGPGWYNGELMAQHGRPVYGERVAFFAEIELSYASGRRERILTDESWLAAAGEHSYADLYHGETVDAAHVPEWGPAVRISQDLTVLRMHDGLPVREQEELPVARRIITPAGEVVLDFGINISGYVRFTVWGETGDRVRYDHAEILDGEGNFYTANMRSARNTIDYRLAGGGEAETFRPRFTFQGFRYIRLLDWPGGPEAACPGQFRAVVIHSDYRETADFHCSHPGLVRLHQNIVRSMKGNFVDIPTDCPQRDERLGWTGDAEVFAETAMRLGDTRLFWRKWLRDMAAAQLPDGGIPHVVPDILTRMEDGVLQGYAACGWADAAVIVPWRLFERYGDLGLLAEHYPMMRAWVDYIRARATDGVLWDTGFHFGDWLALDAEPGSYFGATPNPLTATAHYARSVELLARAARVLGRAEEAVELAELRARIGCAFRERFQGPDGRLLVCTQTAAVLALAFNLLTPDQRGAVVEQLLELIDAAGGALTTGFLGTPWLCEVLAENGHLDRAYALLLREDYPSWLYPISRGATTIWEHWDGIRPDGTLWSADMNSFNHYAYGSIGSWMHRVIGGIRFGDPRLMGRELIIAPRPGGGLTWADHALDTDYGRVRVRWEIEDDVFAVDVTIPPNCEAELCLPWSGRRLHLGSGQHRHLDSK